MNAKEHLAPPCPQCGKPDSARMCRSEWGHTRMCCSDECGIAYRDSAERCRVEIDECETIIRCANMRKHAWEERLAELREKRVTDAR